MLAIPFLTAAQLADPARQAARYRIPLLNQVAVLGMPPTDARRRTVVGAHAVSRPATRATALGRPAGSTGDAELAVRRRGRAGGLRAALFPRVSDQREVSRLRRSAGAADGTAGVARHRQGTQRHALRAANAVSTAQGTGGQGDQPARRAEPAGVADPRRRSQRLDRSAAQGGGAARRRSCLVGARRRRLPRRRTRRAHPRALPA